MTPKNCQCSFQGQGQGLDLRGQGRKDLASRCQEAKGWPRGLHHWFFMDVSFGQATFILAPKVNVSCRQHSLLIDHDDSCNPFVSVLLTADKRGYKQKTQRRRAPKSIPNAQFSSARSNDIKLDFTSAAIQAAGYTRNPLQNVRPISSQHF